VFSVHIDVVPAGCPGQFTLKREGDRIEGRGVRDCKGNAVVAAEVLCGLVGKNVSVGCVFGPDEEIGGAATRWMVEEKGYVPNRMVIVIDAGYGAVSYAQKGQTYVRLKAKGRSGHSSRPWKSDDSITKVMQAYVKIREIWDRRHPLPEDKWSDVMVPTFIKADGGALNIIPGEAELIMNLRSVNPGAKDELVELAREVSDCEVVVTRHSPPVNCDPNHPLLKRLQAVMSKIIGKEIGLDRMVAATDARCFVSCGVPIAMIGAVGDGSHSVDEYQTISTTNDSLPKGDVAREFGAVDERVGLALVAFAEHPRDCGLRSFRSEVLHLAERRLAVFLPPFPVFFFRVKKLSYIGKTLAKPRAWERQRGRCPLIFQPYLSKPTPIS
jgi:acetylornithine deacetylase/succinyl-diaminopimelate desuccinylase-like protein